MKVQELIYMLSKEDPDAEAIIIGERDLFYPVVSIRKLNLKPTHVWQQNNKLADAYKDGSRYAEDGLPCIELRVV
jgi:hypothetical protein